MARRAYVSIIALRSFAGSNRSVRLISFTPDDCQPSAASARERIASSASRRPSQADEPNQAEPSRACECEYEW